MLKYEVVMNDLLQLEPVITSDEVVTGPATSSDANFILANTEVINIDDLRTTCIVPSYAKDLESTISHAEFLEGIMYTAASYFKRETILQPAIKVSHVVKGRIPDAVHKPVALLQPEDQTQYFQRIAFSIEIPSIIEEVNGNNLALSIVGVRSYDLNALNGKKKEELFKIGIGFINKVCTNLCLWTSGFKAELRARSVSEIIKEAYSLFSSFRPELQLQTMSSFGDYSLTEHEFAQLIGRSRLYQFLPIKVKKEISDPIPLMDSQVSTVAKDYYSNRSFCRNSNGNIDLWKLYNLFTGANKSSYIDTFLDRSVGASVFIGGLQKALNGTSRSWFLS